MDEHLHGRPDGRVDLSTFIRRVVKSGDTGVSMGFSICSSTKIRTSLVHFSRSLHHLFGNPKVEHLVVDPQLLDPKNPYFRRSTGGLQRNPTKIGLTSPTSQPFCWWFQKPSAFFLGNVWEEHFFEGAITVKYSSFCDLGKDFGSSYWNIVFLVHQVGWGEVQWIFQLISLDLIWTSDSYSANNIDVENQPFVDYFSGRNHGFPHLC